MKFGKKKSSDKDKFKYRPLSSEHMQERKNQKGGDFEPYVNQNIKIFSPSNGENTIRILPGTWEDAEGYGFEVQMHYSIGADKQSYLCPLLMKEEECPVCKERKKADKAGDDAYAKELKTTKRVAVYLIDRDKEGEGPKIWFMPYTFEREIAAQAIDSKSGEVLQFPDPEDGYDLTFSKEGKEFPNIKYVGAKFDRKSSPL